MFALAVARNLCALVEYFVDECGAHTETRLMCRREQMSFSATPLWMACARGDPRMIEMLARRGADMNALCDQGTSAFQRPQPVNFQMNPIMQVSAVSNVPYAKPGWTQQALAPSSMGDIDLNAINVKEVTAQVDSGELPALNILSAIFSAPSKLGKKLPQEIRDLKSHLHACSFGIRHIVKLLIDRGADLSLPDARGRSCLMYAVNCSLVCKMLVEHGADVNARDHDLNTSLH